MSIGVQPSLVGDLAAFTARLDGLRIDQNPDDLSVALRAAFEERDLYDIYVSSLDTDRVKELLEVFDKVLTATYNAAIFGQFWQLCGRTGLLPTSHTIPGKPIQMGEYPVASGRSADVWEGICNDRRVAIKIMRASEYNVAQGVKKITCEEVVMWKRISHPNVVPFLGVSETPIPLSMISEWMPNGNVRDYVLRNPGTSRLQLLLDISRGLSFLHSLEIVHGDLKGDNVLIDGSGCARLCDFGFTTVTGIEYAYGYRFRGAHRWTAPELFDTGIETNEGSLGLSTCQSDVFSLGMVTLEVFTGQIPFPENVVTLTVAIRIKDGERPSRPPKGRELGLSDELWEVVRSSLAQEVDERPPVSTFVDFLEKVTPDITMLKELTKFDANTEDKTGVDVISVRPLG